MDDDEFGATYNMGVRKTLLRSDIGIMLWPPSAILGTLESASFRSDSDK